MTVWLNHWEISHVPTPSYTLPHLQPSRRHCWPGLTLELFSPWEGGGARPPPPPPGSPYSLGGSNGWRTLKSIIHPDVGKLTASGESIHVLFTGVYSLNRTPGSENTDAGKKHHTPSIREIHLLRCCVPHLDDVSGLFDHGRLVSTQYTRARNRKEGGGGGWVGRFGYKDGTLQFLSFNLTLSDSNISVTAAGVMLHWPQRRCTLLHYPQELSHP